jgi:hypothetical protein
MEYGLSRPGSDVQHSTVALLNVALAGDLCSRQVAAANEFGVRHLGLFQACEMFLGDDKYVSRRLRTYVFESENVVIFVDLFGRDLAADDPAEKAGGGWIGHNKNPVREETIAPW